MPVTSYILGEQNLNITFTADLKPMVTITGLYISEEETEPDLSSLTDGIHTFAVGSWRSAGLLYDEDKPYILRGKNSFRIYYNHHKQRLRFFVNDYPVRSVNVKWENKTYYFHLLGEAEDLQITDIPLDDDIYQDDNTIAYLPFSADFSDPCGNLWHSEGPVSIDPLHTEEGNGAQFSGAGYLQCDNYIILGGQDFTIDGFCYIDPETERQGRIFSLYEEGKGEAIALLRNNNTNQFLLCYQEDRDTLHSGGLGPHGTEDVVGKTIHFAVVYEHTKQILTLYVNSVVDIRVGVPQYDAKPLKIRLGAKYTGDHKLKGTIDEFRISTVARWVEDEDVIALLRFNHYVYRDEVADNWSVYNVPVLTTDHAYVGKALSCQASGVYKNLTLGDTSFTVDFYGYTTMTGIAPSFFSMDDLRIGLKNNTKDLCVSVNGSDTVVEEDVTGDLHHFAVVYNKDNNKILIFVDGIKKKEITASIASKQRQIRIGYSTITGSVSKVIIDDLRITKRAVWSENFILPTETLLVIHDTPVQSNILYYNTEIQRPTFSGYDENSVILSYTPQIDGGSYIAIFTPRPGFVWEDGTRSPLSVTWKILPVEPFITTSEKDIIMSPYTSYVQITAYSTGRNKLYVESSNPDIIMSSIGNTVITNTGSRAYVNLYRRNYGGVTITIFSHSNQNYTYAKEEISVFSERRSGSLTLDTEYAMLTASRSTIEIPYSKLSTGAMTYSLSYTGVVTVSITPSVIRITRVSSGSTIIALRVAEDPNYEAVYRFLRIDSIEHGQMIVAIEDPKTLEEEFYRAGLPDTIQALNVNGWSVLGEPYLSTLRARFGASLQLTGSVILERKDLILGGKDFTIDFWYYLHNSTSKDGVILWIGNSRGQYLCLARKGKTSQLVFYAGYREYVVPVDLVSRIAILTHTAIIYDHKEKTINLFLTGKKVVTAPFSQGKTAQDLILRIGGLSYGIQQMTGSVDEFRISDCLRWSNKLFSPYEYAYTTDTNTLELLHFDITEQNEQIVSSLSNKYTELVNYSWSGNKTQSVVNAAVYAREFGDPPFEITGNGWVNITYRQIQFDYGIYNNYLTYKLEYDIYWDSWNSADLQLCEILQFSKSDILRIGYGLPLTNHHYKNKISLKTWYKLAMVSSYKNNVQTISLFLDDLLWVEQPLSRTAPLSKAGEKCISILVKNQEIYLRGFRVSVI